jgi:enediyne biosynthesis protein E4
MSDLFDQNGMSKTLRIFLIAAALIAAHRLADGQKPSIEFKDISSTSGVNVSHISSPESRYIVESMSGGVVIFDCDSDGFLDVATVNGSSVGRFASGGDPFVTLYRQIDGATNKTPRFVNVTAAAGLLRKGWGMGITAVDLDSDGIRDIFATGFNGNAVFRGKGECKYSDITYSTNLKGDGFMTGAAWSDFDRDGDLDVAVPRYVSLDLRKLPVFGSSPTCSFKGIRVQCGPRGLPGESDLFFRNKGSGVFEEVSAQTKTGDPQRYYGLGVTWGDYDNDGWPDLYVANDASQNLLFRNERKGELADVSFESGTAYSNSGIEQGSMGVTWGDYDNDGMLDLFVTNFDNENNALYKNLGSKGFLEVSMEAKVGAPSIPYVGWGTAFVDLDNDGFLDLLVVNGHVYPQIDLVQSSTQMGFRQHFLLHRNLGNGTFEEISTAAGLRSLPMRSRRGAAFGDLNEDGFVDAVISNLGEPPTVLLNVSNSGNRSVTLKLVQNGLNRDAIGSRVAMKTNQRRMIREVEAGGSYLSQNDTRLYFGLGLGERIESVEVRWSNGETERISGVLPERLVIIEKSKGITHSTEFRKRAAESNVDERSKRQ